MDVKEDFDDSYSEVFFGRLTLKEVKKRIFMDVHQKNLPRFAAYDRNNVNGNNEFKLIEASSQPNILLPNHSEEMHVEHLKSTSDPIFNRNKPHIELNMVASVDCDSEDSFLEIESNVKEQCKPLNNCDKNLDNTLEFVDFILNHAQSHNKGKDVQTVLPSIMTQEKEIDGNNVNYFKSEEIPEQKILSKLTTCNEEPIHEDHDNTEKLELDLKCLPTPPMPFMHKEIVHKTPSKSQNIKPEKSIALNTPVNIKKEASNLFKTPKIPLSSQKETSSKKTPSRSKTYEHIASPIANYIKNCPQVPLVKDVHPKKPLPSTSLIPKLLKNAPESNSNKENIVLPQLAYRSAKKTVVIDVNKEKLPRSLWAQKLTSSSQKPVVLKHNHREIGRKPFSIQQEDSFQDLTLHQAEVSVCTEKLAFNKLN